MASNVYIYSIRVDALKVKGPILSSSLRLKEIVIFSFEYHVALTVEFILRSFRKIM